jgi:teichuronic acid biosynthesis glycosyltransferase TuaC
MTDVLWVTPTYPWPQEPAFGIFYQTQAQAVRRMGVEVTVACPTPWAPWPLSRASARWRRYAEAPRHGFDGNVPVIRPPYVNVPGEPSWAGPDRRIAGAVWRSRRSWNGARVIHGHYAMTGLAAWRLARRTKLPFVLTFHGSDINTWPDDHPERQADFRTALQEASAVFAVSQALADRAKAITGVATTHLPLGCDHRALAAGTVAQEVARTRLGLPEDRVIVLFVGNLKRAKGVRELVDSVLRLGDPFTAVLVGDGPERGYGTTDPRANRLLDFRGAVPHDEVVAYMCAADVLVLPSYNEGMPTVFVEAGSLRLPVIGSAVGGIPELLGSDRGTVLPDIRPETIAASLLDFMNDRAAASAASDRLHDHVLASYDVDRNAAHLVATYCRIAPSLSACRSDGMGGPP